MTSRNVHNYRALDCGFDPRAIGIGIIKKGLEPDENGVLTLLYEDPDGKKLEAVDVTPDEACKALTKAGYDVD